MTIFKKIMLGLLIVAADLFIYLVLGLLLMVYDDFYDASEGPYWSMSSMTTFELTVYIIFNIWNFLNLAAAGYLIFIIAKKLYQLKRPLA